MSFGGFTSFAKNALLTAQKHIDTALHIEEEEIEVDNAKVKDAQTDEIEDNDGDASTSLYESALLNLSTRLDSTETKNEDNPSCNVDKQHQNDFLDVDLNGPSPPESHWGGRGFDKNQAVVDTEPNPIRDAHEPANILHYSPCSHSPDDEESSQNGHSSTSLQHIKVSELEDSLVNFEKERTHESDELEQRNNVVARRASEKTLDRFEEVRTIASSDIEVIRQMDAWSITSSRSHQYGGNQNQEMFASVNLKEVFQPATGNSMMASTATEIGQKSELADNHSQQDMQENIAILAAKLKHRDQRIEELGRLNENLKQSNATLATKNKQKTLAETKMQSQLADKERQLKDLLEEGKRLSEYSGRQAKEIRKLKQQLSQLEVVTAARDSAVQEFQEAVQQMQEQEATIAELKAEEEKAEKRAEHLKNDLQKSQTHSSSLEKQLCEQLIQLEKVNAELKRLDKEAKSSQREKEELITENRQLSAKLMNKTAQERRGGEREQGMVEDLQAEKAKNAQAVARIRELEQRLETVQDAQRDIAVEISNANSPLLNTIAGLEEKVFSLERQNESLSRSLRQTTEQMAEQKGKYELEKELARKSQDSQREINALREEEMARMEAEHLELHIRLRKCEEEMESAQKTSEIRTERLEQKVEELEAELKAKRMELLELQRKNREMQQKLARKEEFFPSVIEQPPTKPIRSEANSVSGGVQVEFQQEKEQFKANRPKSAYPKPSALPNSQKNRAEDLNMPGSATDYSLDVASAEHLRAELDSAQAQLFQLHERFDHLLELYGGCLESIEELKEDNEDLRRLCKEQALRLAEGIQEGSQAAEQSEENEGEEA